MILRLAESRAPGARPTPAPLLRYCSRPPPRGSSRTWHDLSQYPAWTPLHAPRNDRCSEARASPPTRCASPILLELDTAPEEPLGATAIAVPPRKHRLVV